MPKIPSIDKGLKMKFGQTSDTKIFANETKDSTANPSINDRYEVNFKGEKSNSIQPFLVRKMSFIKTSVTGLSKGTDDFINTKPGDFDMKGSHNEIEK